MYTTAILGTIGSIVLGVMLYLAKQKCATTTTGLMQTNQTMGTNLAQCQQKLGDACDQDDLDLCNSNLDQCNADLASANVPKAKTNGGGGGGQSSKKANTTTSLFGDGRSLPTPVQMTKDIQDQMLQKAHEMAVNNENFKSKNEGFHHHIKPMQMYDTSVNGYAFFKENYSPKAGISINSEQMNLNKWMTPANKQGELNNWDFDYLSYSNPTYWQEETLSKKFYDKEMKQNLFRFNDKCTR